MSRRENGLNHEESVCDMKGYLCTAATILKFNAQALSYGGMGDSRSVQSIVNNITLYTLLFIIDDDALFHRRSEQSENKGLLDNCMEIEQGLSSGIIHAPDNTLNHMQIDLISRVNVLLNLVLSDTLHQKQTGEILEAADMSYDKAFQIAARIIEPLTDQERVKKELEEIKNDPEKAKLFRRRLDFELKDIIDEREKEKRGENYVQLDFLGEIY